MRDAIILCYFVLIKLISEMGFQPFHYDVSWLGLFLRSLVCLAECSNEVPTSSSTLITKKKKKINK